MVPVTKAELNAQIAEICSHFPLSDGPHVDQWHEFLTIDPDLADRDYDAIPSTAEEATR